MKMPKFSTKNIFETGIHVIALSQDFSIDDLSYKNRKRILTFQSIVYTTIRFTDIFLNIFNDPSFQF